MLQTTNMSLAAWRIDEGDDPRFAECALRLIVGAAIVGGQRDIRVLQIDNWFGVRWLGFSKTGIFRRQADSNASEPNYCIPPFHPNRVLSDSRYELTEDGTLRGPFPAQRPLHRRYVTEDRSSRSFKQNCDPGVYAWFSSNTRTNDRASLMVYTHSTDGTSAWYVELRKTDAWRLSRRTLIGDADWHRLLAAGAITEWT
jgi:hypothetical protein